MESNGIYNCHGLLETSAPMGYLGTKYIDTDLFLAARSTDFVYYGCWRVPTIITMSNSIQHLLTSNAQWAEDVLKTQPHFFEESAKGQSPHVCLFLSTPSILTQPLQTLWIGCADSRVPESVVTAARPGEIFVHRNIAKFVSYSVFLFCLHYRQPFPVFVQPITSR